eukprot:223221_1
MTTLVQTVMEWIGYVALFICIPLAIRCNLILFKEKHQMFVQKRNPMILFGLNMTFIWGMITFAGLQFSLLHLSTLYFLTVKQWIIYYKYHWTRFTNDATITRTEILFMFANCAPYVCSSHYSSAAQQPIVWIITAIISQFFAAQSEKEIIGAIIVSNI